MSLPIRVSALAIAAALGGCQALSGSSGVMPESEVGPPPSMQGKVSGRQRSAAVDEDGQALPSNPTRQLALPKTVGGASRSAEAGPRRINREDLEGADTGRGPGGGSVGPTINNGNVGFGGKF